MKVLVLGGTGFIGNPVAKALAREGHEVYVLTRSTEKAKELEADESAFILWEEPDLTKNSRSNRRRSI
jgi:nucleoside-diphosphate-sugar epimerase